MTAADPPPPSSVVAAHVSDSSEQRNAEPLMLAAMATLLGRALAPMELPLGDGARVQIDGAAADMSVFVEIFARQGAMKAGQVQKVTKDALKLITLRRFHPAARLILCFADHVAAARVLGTSWLAEALRLWEIEVVVVDLDEETKALLKAAQQRQFR